MTPPASTPRRSGIVHAALALGGFAIGTTEFATMSILPLFARDLHVDLPTGGRAISAYAIGVVVGAPLLAVGGARLGRRTMLIALMAWVAVANLLSALAPSFGWLLLFRFLSGLPHGAYFGLAALVAASLVEDDRRTVAVGRVMAGLTVATVVGVPAANLLAQMGGWRASFVVAALAAAIVAALPRLPSDNTPLDTLSKENDHAHQTARLVGHRDRARRRHAADRLYPRHVRTAAA